MSQNSGAARRLSNQSFTDMQGQYLAFIYAYSRLFRRSPAEADMQRHFRVSPPSVHQMVLTPRASRPDPTPTPRRTKHRTPRGSRRPAYPEMTATQPAQPVKTPVPSY